ncbi:WbqC family protein [Mucilaginibacter sp. PAMB04274]|uniref:WbqC family protein n=1 Tax=Mucilaginibacter sp. PAMB04274 TaxID=3138568 RepID=UPI0031F6C61E
MMENGALLPMFYLPPVSYFTALNQSKPNILIEKHEHFPKQTYRNRANIYSPDGVLALVVPVVKGAKVHTPVKDVKISNDFAWQRLHWMSLQSCYRRSAYFEFYEDEFAHFYEEQFNFLFDYNEQLLHLLLKFLKLPVKPQYTNEYERNYPMLTDYRNTIHPKKDVPSEQKPYFQVFEERNGFLKDLSIVDLLFNQGPQSVNYL